MKQKRNRLSNDFLYRCRIVREKAGFTQSQVSDDIGCTPQNVSLFENGYNDSATILVWYIKHDGEGVLKYGN